MLTSRKIHLAKKNTSNSYGYNIGLRLHYYTVKCVLTDPQIQREDQNQRSKKSKQMKIIFDGGEEEKGPPITPRQLTFRSAPFKNKLNLKKHVFAKISIKNHKGRW